MEKYHNITNTPPPANHMENYHIIRRLGAMENFLAEMIQKLEEHSEFMFLFDLVGQVPVGSDFDRGKLFMVMKDRMGTAVDDLKAVKRQVHFCLRDFKDAEEGEKPKMF